MRCQVMSGLVLLVRSQYSDLAALKLVASKNPESELSLTQLSSFSFNDLLQYGRADCDLCMAINEELHIPCTFIVQ